MLLVKTKVKPSKIHGLGLFAVERIPAGTFVWKFSPDLDLEIDPVNFKQLPKPAQEYILFHGFLSRRTGKYHLSFDDVRYINHSSDKSNIATADESKDVELPLVALRDILPGEEILQNYDDFDTVARF